MDKDLNTEMLETVLAGNEHILRTVAEIAVVLTVGAMGQGVHTSPQIEEISRRMILLGRANEDVLQYVRGELGIKPESKTARDADRRAAIEAIVNDLVSSLAQA